MQWKQQLAVVLCAVALVAGCDSEPQPPKKSVMQSIRDSRKLVVLTRNAPTTYYEGRDGPEGYEYALVTRFAASLGVKPEFRVFHSVDDLLAAIRKGEGHIAAAGITRTEARAGNYQFGPEYFSVLQQVVCRRGGTIPKSVKELAQVRLRVTAGTSYAERLKQLQKKFPELHWEETTGQGTERLLREVWNRKIDCTVADSNIVAINRRYMPELVVAFPLTQEQRLAWILPSEDKELSQRITDWFDAAETNGLLDRLYERYYGYTEIFDYVDVRVFMRRINRRLPDYEALFRRAAERYQLPWTLLAAQAYQESHWNPGARSPTGVRGMMMLTRPTANELGISNRLDPTQSIRGGSKYLARIVKRLPESVEGQDRYWFALAAYNVGYGHLRDARALAKQLGKNPDRWVDLKDVLPLLGEEQYYKGLRYGYARGWEPVDYVQRIRDYRDVLEQRLAKRGVTHQEAAR